MNKIRFTIFTKPSPGIMTKNIKFVDGELEKDGTQCWLSTGTADTIKTPFKDLGGRLDSIETNQAVAWGVCKHQKTKIVKQTQEISTPDAISRTGQHFDFLRNQPAVMMLDNDTGLATADLIDTVESVMPQMKGVARIERPSCSSDIYANDQLLTYEGAGRIYYLVDDGSQIPRIGKILHKLLILAGHGHVQLTKSGSMLVRSLVDDCVWQAERLDFVAAPVLGKGLERRAQKSRYVDGTTLVAADIEDLTNDEELRLDAITRGLKAVEKPEAEKVKVQYIDAEADKLVKISELKKADAVKVVNQRAAGNLVSNDLLHFDDLGGVTVAAVLKDPTRYDLETLADPLEPDYGGGRCKAMFFANDGSPTIHSFAHGSRNYRLGEPVELGCLETSEKPGLTLPGGGTTLNECAISLGKMLAATGRFYVRNGELFEVTA